MLFLQFVFNMEQGIPVLPEWLSFNRVNARARKDVEIGPARFLLRYCIQFVFRISRKIILKMHGDGYLKLDNTFFVDTVSCSCWLMLNFCDLRC